MLIRRIKKRGATAVVEAHGEVLFAETGDVGAWTRRFSQRARAYAALAAPTNKRPRWGHYGDPLKSTMRASTSYHPSRMRVYSAVGTTARHGLYVDQGTGIYAGNGPYPAKVLPPWTRGSPSLYEHTWNPPGGWANHVVMISGQRGQEFLDTGVRRAFRAMRMRSFQLPGEGASGMSNALKSYPETLANFSGATPADGAFRASLKEWRAWRDDAFNSGRLMGNRRAAQRFADLREQARRARADQREAQNRAAYRERERERSQRNRDKAKALRPPREERDEMTASQQRRQIIAAEKARFLAAAQKKYGASNVDRGSLEWDSATNAWYITVKHYVRNEHGDGRTRAEFKEIRGRILFK